MGNTMTNCCHPSSPRNPSGNQPFFNPSSKKKASARPSKGGRKKNVRFVENNKTTNGLKSSIFLDQAAASLNKKLTPTASAEDQGSHKEVLATKSIPDLSLIEEVKDIRSLFVFDRKIGEGKFGTVFLAHPRGDLKSSVAIKLIPQKSFSNRIEKELALLRSIQHENIIRYISAYRDKAFFYIVTEYCEGGELFQKIVDQGGIDELEACGIISQLLSALKVLHDGTYSEDAVNINQTQESQQIAINIDSQLSK